MVAYKLEGRPQVFHTTEEGYRLMVQKHPPGSIKLIGAVQTVPGAKEITTPIANTVAHDYGREKEPEITAEHLSGTAEITFDEASERTYTEEEKAPPKRRRRRSSSTNS